MLPEITIKISFVPEGTSTALVAGSGVAVTAPPEAPRDATLDQIPPPPEVEDFYREMAEAAAIPPPPMSTGPESDVGGPPPPEA